MRRIRPQQRSITDGTYRIKNDTSRPKADSIKDEPKTKLGPATKTVLVFLAIIAAFIMLFNLIGGLRADEPSAFERINIVTPTEKVEVEREVEVIPDVCFDALKRANEISELSNRALDAGGPQVDLLSAARRAILDQDFNRIAEVETEQRQLSGSYAEVRNKLANDIGTYEAELESCLAEVE